MELLDQVHCLVLLPLEREWHYSLGFSIILRSLFHLSSQKFCEVLLLYFKYTSIRIKLEMHPVIIHIHASMVACLVTFYPKQSCPDHYPLVIKLYRTIVYFHPGPVLWCRESVLAHRASGSARPCPSLRIQLSPSRNS